MYGSRPTSPSPSARTGLSALTSSSRASPSAPSSVRSTAHSRGPSGETTSQASAAPAAERFSVVVSLLAGPRAPTSAVDAILPMRFVQKRKSTSGPLNLTSSAAADSPHRALHPKPSMLSMPSSSSSSSSSRHPDKSRRVRLVLVPATSAVLEIRDESKDKVLVAVDLGRTEARAVHLAHRSTVHLPHVLFLPLSTGETEHAAGEHPPASPSVPTFRANLAFERCNSPAPLGRGQASPYSARRPGSSSSVSFNGSPLSGEKARSKGSREGGMHLAFDTLAEAQSWLALFKSLAIPEIYHCPSRVAFSTTPDGDCQPAAENTEPRPFRLKRHLRITICEARALIFSTAAQPSTSSSVSNQSYGTLRSPISPSTPVPYDLRSPGLYGRPTPAAERDAPAVFVELVSGAHVIGRTTTKRRTTAPFWDETLAFPFYSVAPAPAEGGEMLTLVVYREKATDRLAVVGRVEISLSGLINEDAWWPILSETGRRMGDLRLKLRATEQVVFPLVRYGELAILARQATDPIDSLLAATLWRRDLDQSLAAETIMKISTARGKIAEVVGGMVAREDLSADTLFRSNTPFTKCLDSCLKAFLLSSFIPLALFRTVNRVLDEKIAIEILPPSSSRAAPSHHAGLTPEDADRHLTEAQRRELEGQRQALRRLVESCWEDIYAARHKVPEHVRDALRKIFLAVPPEVKWRAITTLFFLRLVSPVIIDPHAYGLTLAVPEGPARRTLVLLAKAISALSYGGLSDKQPEMYLVMNDFAAERHEQVVDFIAYVTRKDDDDSASIHGREPTGIEGILAGAVEGEAANGVADLVRESLELKPFYLDTAADSAVFAGLLERALAMIAEGRPGQPPRYPELGALVARIRHDEQDALEFLLQSRMSVSPASFLPRSFIPGYLSLPLTPSVEDDWLLNRPPTRTSRSHTISDPPGLQAPSRPSLNRGRSESTSTVRDGDDLVSDCALATLGRTRTAETSARRPSLPTALLSPRLPTPVFGLESKTSLRTRLGSSEDDDDWLKDERHYAEQRATFAAKISPRLPNSSINMDARIPLSASRPVAKTTPVDQTTTTGGRRRWKVWNIKL